MPRGGSNNMINSHDLAVDLAIEHRTLIRHYRSWGLTAYKIGRVVCFRQRDVDQWLTTREVGK